jgi:hypothetical protein
MKRTLVIAGLALILLALYLQRSPRSGTAAPLAAKPVAGAAATGAAVAPLGTSPQTFATQPVAGDAAAAASPQSTEQASLKVMVKTLCTFAVGQKNLDDLVGHLKSNDEDPVIVRDSIPYTGDMIIIRTNHPPDGTRYFHAQYFEGKGGKQFPQHMSFEFKPGPDAMKQVTSAVQDSCEGLGRPRSQKDDFVEWDRGNGYVMWIKRLGPQDLENNPFNAYTAEDAGSIRVAIELNPEE